MHLYKMLALIFVIINIYLVSHKSSSNHTSIPSSEIKLYRPPMTMKLGYTALSKLKVGMLLLYSTAAVQILLQSGSDFFLKWLQNDDSVNL